MTAAEVYELTTHGGATDFASVIQACERFGPYCLIGGLAVNCYVEPVYTLDANLVLVGANVSALAKHLHSEGFKTEEFAHSLNALTPNSRLGIQFATDQRYQAFLAHAVDAEVLGSRVKVACLEDVTQGKLWAYGDPRRRFARRKKDELDLIRLAEAHPALKALYPAELIELIESAKGTSRAADRIRNFAKASGLGVPVLRVFPRRG